MRKLTLILLAGMWPVLGWAHGPGHIHRSTDAETFAVEPVDAHAGHDHGDSSKSGKSFVEPVLESESRWWGASLTTGWESRHVHYGVDETGNYGAYTTELAVSIGDFMLGAWSGFGTGNDFQEWDFTAAYNIEVGPVFFIPGYNLRYTPEVEDAHGGDEHGSNDEHEGEHHEDEHHDDHGSHDDLHAGHSHETYGNELFFVLGTTAIPYVTPNVAFIWDLNRNPGGIMELRLDGEIPVIRNFSLEPYALLGLNFGYNTTAYYGWNNFQFGVQANWQINRVITAFAGVNYSVAMTALQEIDQGDVVWANVGVTFAY